MRGKRDIKNLLVDSELSDGVVIDVIKDADVVGWDSVVFFIRIDKKKKTVAKINIITNPHNKIVIINLKLKKKMRILIWPQFAEEFPACHVFYLPLNLMGTRWRKSIIFCFFLFLNTFAGTKYFIHYNKNELEKMEMWEKHEIVLVLIVNCTH